MADQTTSYNAEGKFTGVNVDPLKLTVVGVDCPEEERPELADPQRLQLAIDPLMVRSIREHGIQEPVRIRKFPNDERTYVASGRRRVLHARVANEEIADGEKILVPCVPIGRGADVAVSHVIGNRFRVDNTPLMNAEEAARLLERGHPEAYVLSLFGVKKSTLSNWLDLRSAPPKIKKAVEDRQITATVAVDIARSVEPAKQDDALAAAIEAGRGAAAQEAVAVRKRRNGNGADDGKPRRLSIAQMKRFAEIVLPSADHDGTHAQDDDLRFAHAVMRAVLGDVPKALREYPAVAKALRKALKGEEGRDA